MSFIQAGTLVPSRLNLAELSKVRVLLPLEIVALKHGAKSPHSCYKEQLITLPQDTISRLGNLNG